MQGRGRGRGRRLQREYTYRLRPRPLRPLKWAVSPPSEALGACMLPGDVWQSAPRCRGRAVGGDGEAQGKSRAEGAGPADEDEKALQAAGSGVGELREIPF